MVRIAWALLLLVPILGCGGGAHLHGRVFRDDEAHYRIGELSPDWTRITVANNDLAFHDASLEAIIEVNASCDPAGDIPLTVLTNHLLAGFTQRQILSQDLLPMDGREALRSHVIAALDGVPREFLIFVMKKDDCVYDFVLIAPEGTPFQRSQAIFEGFVGGFTTDVSGS